MRLRFLALASLLVTLAGLIGCGGKPSAADKTQLPNVTVGPGSGVSPDSILSPLYPPVAAPAYATVVARGVRPSFHGPDLRHFADFLLGR